MSSSPRFLLDENVPAEVGEFLKSKGLQVERVPKGTKNGKVALLARERRVVLLTRDADFSDSSLFPPREYFGIVVLRIHPPTPERLVEGASALLKQVKDFKGKLFLVGEGWIRTSAGE